MEMANPLLESFREPPKACVTNSSRTPAHLKGKGNPDLPSVCSNYWPPIMALSLIVSDLFQNQLHHCVMEREINYVNFWLANYLPVHENHRKR